jgi:hypothetical protein
MSPACLGEQKPALGCKGCRAWETETPSVCSILQRGASASKCADALSGGEGHRFESWSTCRCGLALTLDLRNRRGTVCLTFPRTPRLILEVRGPGHEAEYPGRDSSGRARPCHGEGRCRGRGDDRAGGRRGSAERSRRAGRNWRRPHRLRAASDPRAYHTSRLRPAHRRRPRPRDAPRTTGSVVTAPTIPARPGPPSHVRPLEQQRALTRRPRRNGRHYHRALDPHDAHLPLAPPLQRDTGDALGINASVQIANVHRADRRTASPRRATA